jgi:hypothetical protein
MHEDEALDGLLGVWLNNPVKLQSTMVLVHIVGEVSHFPTCVREAGAA